MNWKSYKFKYMFAEFSFRKNPLMAFTVIHKFFFVPRTHGGSGSIIGIANGYRLHGPAIESQWGRYFPHLSRPALGPTQPPLQWVPSLSRGYRAAGA